MGVRMTFFKDKMPARGGLQTARAPLRVLGRTLRAGCSQPFASIPTPRCKQPPGKCRAAVHNAVGGAVTGGLSTHTYARSLKKFWGTSKKLPY